MRRSVSSFRGRLTFAMVLVAVLVVGAVGAAVAAFEVAAAERRARANLETLTLLVLRSIEPSVDFDLPDEAAQRLAQLEGAEGVIGARLFRAVGSSRLELFANYSRAGIQPVLGIGMPVEGFRSDGNRGVHARSVYRGEAPVMLLEIEADLATFRRGVGALLALLGTALVLATLAALYLARTLQRSVSRPLNELVAVARRVREQGDYAERARVQGDDEFAELAIAFNQMLEAVRARGRELEDSHRQLEERVGERTAELNRRVEEVERLNHHLSSLMRDLQASQGEAERIAADLRISNTRLMVANQELEAFSYSVSHDLRAPLRNISGFIELVRRRAPAESLPPEVARHLGIVASETVRMGALIDDLLSLSRIGRTQMRWQRVELPELLEEVKAELAHELGGRRIEWVINPVPACHGDRALLRQVVANLVGNALKFTRNRAVACLQLGCLEDGAGVEYFLRDNGVGFNPAFADKLFRVFQRLHNPREFEGTGIGLAIVQRILARHGGRIRAEACEGEGACFYFRIGQSPEIAGNNPT